MKPNFFYLVCLLVLSVFGGAHAASNVRFKEIDPVEDTLVIKNYGDTIEDISDWILSSRGTNIGIAGDPRVDITIGSLAITAGAEVTLTIINSPSFLGRRQDDLALHKTTELSNSNSVVDYIVWGGSGGFRESVAVSAGIWAQGDVVEFGEVFRYTGDGSDTGPRAGWWSPQQTNIRLLSVDPVNNQFSLKNFDTTTYDVTPWLFTIGGTTVKVVGSSLLSVASGSTLLAPGDVITYQVSNILLDPDGNGLGVHRSDSVTLPGGIVDFVQWVTWDNIREPVANERGIWSVNALLPASTTYHYYGDGTDTGVREGYWNESVPQPAPPIEARLRFNGAGQPLVEFSTVAGRRYQVQYSAAFASWTAIGSQITGTGSNSTWVDIAAPSRRFYRVVDVTP